MKNILFKHQKLVSKGQLLLSQGEIAQYGYWVRRGCLKSYVIDGAGKEHIMQFAPENWMISDLESITHQVPSNVFIEAIEDSELSVIHKSEIEDLSRFDKEVLIEISANYRNSLIASNKRIAGLLSATSEQRYIEFTETYPTLVQRLPQKLIAAYIGVTPEYLSGIRRKIARK